jgi:hypothetical protein
MEAAEDLELNMSYEVGVGVIIFTFPDDFLW